MLSRRPLDLVLPLAMATLFLLSLVLTVQQFHALELLKAHMREARRLESAVALNSPSLSLERVFNFPLSTCAPQTSPTPLLASLANLPSDENDPIVKMLRDQFRSGLLLSTALLCGLVLGFALTQRTAARESRVAQMKSAFVSNISHEMKTPVSVIRMYAEMLEMGRASDPAKLQEYSRVIQRESQRLGQFMEDILEYAKLESGRREFRFTKGPIDTVVERAVEEFEPQAMTAGCELNVEIGRLPEANVDSRALTQVIHNLLSNALKYSGDSKEIHITARETSGQIAISVSDKGVGIAPSEHKRIFEKFYRVESELVHNTKGAGLGLAIADQIVKAHGGRIAVNSTPGAGSCFTILLPPS